jgi:hypothetical protein
MENAAAKCAFFLLPLPFHLHIPDLIDLRAAERKKTAGYGADGLQGVLEGE